MSDATIQEQTPAEADLLAANVAWNLESLLPDNQSVDDLLDEADALADELAQWRGRVAGLNAPDLATVMRGLAEIQERTSRAGHYVMLRLSENTLDAERGAAHASFEQRSSQITTKVLFVDLEWASADPAHAEAVEADPALAFCAHHLGLLRQAQPHMLSEAQETILTEKAVTGTSAWVRLFSELMSSIEVELPPAGDEPAGTAGLEVGLSRLLHPDREVRRTSAEAVTAGLAPGLRTRAFVFNNLLADKSIDDRLRNYPSWVSSRNRDNEASDESVQALVEAVVGRYDIPNRWYSLKAKVLGVDKLADYDRSASVATSEKQIGWTEATAIVRDSYASFSPELADIVGRFIDESWIDAPVRPGKRPGAFCAYSTPSHHPYVLLNWTGRTRDVATLAHELGHGVHGYLSREQSIFEQMTPLTLAETASVFGETVTNERLLSMIDDPSERFALLAGTLEDSIATVFRQVAMNRFEHAVHTERREVGELSLDRFGELWAETQEPMFGDAVEITDGYRTWWSYIPHFIGSPGYVYAYAYGQLLALSVYARYVDRGEGFVPNYLNLLKAGGSLSPVELGAIVDCDLADPGFWDAGLCIVDDQLKAAEAAASQAGRL